jgi:hypothetical protein
VKDIHTQIVEFARKKYIDNKARVPMVWDNLKMIKEDLWGFLNKIIGRSPMIVTTFVYMSREWFKQEMDVSADEALIGRYIRVARCRSWIKHTY